MRQEPVTAATQRPATAGRPVDTPRRVSRGARVFLVITAALALHAPTLNMGFLGDDYFHQATLRGISEHTTMRPWSLYDFGTLPDDVNDPVRQSGAFPWWTSPDWKARFLRPLTSVTLWADHALFGDWATGYHLTSLTWYAGLLVLAYRLYRALGLSPNTALLALALLAVSDSCILPVAWPANRNSLLATFFIVASVLAVSRVTVWKPARALCVALALASLACLAKESGVIAFALIIVYLRRTAGGPDARCPKRWVNVGTAASLLIAGGCIVFFIASGRGTNTVFYAMPWSDGGLFLQRAAHLPFLAALSLLGLYPIDAMTMVPHAAVAAIPIAAILVGPFAWVVWKHVRTHPAAPFALLWILIALVPQAAAPPSDRLLFCASVGSSALLALFISGTLRRREQPARQPWLPRVLAAAAVCCAGLLSCLSVLVHGLVMAKMAPEIRRTILSADVGPTTLGTRDVFLLQLRDPYLFLAIQSTWQVEADDHDVRFWAMQAGRRALRWTRLDERTFELKTLDEPFLTELFERVFLSGIDPATERSVWQTPLFAVKAVEVGPDGLRSFRVRCQDSLDTPRYRFLIPRDGKLVAIRPPAIARSIDIERVTAPPLTTADRSPS